MRMKSDIKEYCWIKYVNFFFFSCTFLFLWLCFGVCFGFIVLLFNCIEVFLNTRFYIDIVCVKDFDCCRSLYVTSHGTVASFALCTNINIWSMTLLTSHQTSPNYIQYLSDFVDELVSNYGQYLVVVYKSANKMHHRSNCVYIALNGIA